LAPLENRGGDAATTASSTAVNFGSGLTALAAARYRPCRKGRAPPTTLLGA
jgi:hypothetical protein